MIKLDILLNQMQKDLEEQKSIMKNVYLPDLLAMYHKGQVDILKKYIKKIEIEKSRRR